MKKVRLYWYLNQRITDNHILSEVFVDLNKLEMKELTALKKKLDNHPGGVLMKLDRELCLKHVNNLIEIKKQGTNNKECTE